MKGYVGPEDGGRDSRARRVRWVRRPSSKTRPAESGRRGASAWKEGRHEREGREGGHRKNGEGGRAFMVSSMAASRLAAVSQEKALGPSR